MVSTGYYYPAVVVTDRYRTPYWETPSNVALNQATGALEGGSNSGYAHGTITSIPAGKPTDGLRGSTYGFNIPKNARIDGITVRSVRLGYYNKDNSAILVVGGSSLANKAKKRQRTDWNLMVDYYGGATDKWGSSSLKPSIINSDSFKFLFSGTNTASSAHGMWYISMGVNVDYTNPVYSITNELPSTVLTGSTISYTVTVTSTNNVTQGEALGVVVPLPAGFTLKSYNASSGTFDGSTGAWNPVIGSDYKATLTLVCTIEGSGNISQTVQITDAEATATNTATVNVVTSDPGSVASAEAPLTDPTLLKNLINGETYTIIGYNKVVDSGYSGIAGGIKNNRICVVNSETILGSRVTTQGSYQKVSVQFQYNSSQPLTLRLYGQYQSLSTVSQEYWGKFAVMKGDELIYEVPSNLFSDPSLLESNMDYASVTLDSTEETAQYSYDFGVIPNQGDNTFFKGVLMSLDCLNTANSEIELQLINDQGISSNFKSYVLGSDETIIQLGGENDLWGLKSEDIDTKNISLLITVKNTSLSTITPEFKNLQLLFYWATDETNGAEGFTIDGTHSRNYGIIMYDYDVPEGVEPSLNELTMSRMDGSLITSQTDKSKALTINFRVFGDDLTDATTKLKEINTWLANTRNSMCLPTPKSLIFDFDHTRQYEVLLSKPISSDPEYSVLDCEAEFIVPKGVALSATEKVTGSTGTNDGIIGVRPNITLLATGESSITVTDTVTSQSVTINHTITSGTLITIDSSNRTVTDSNGVDYTQYIDINSVWFSFMAGYDLTCTGGVIQNIAYYEGY